MSRYRPIAPKPEVPVNQNPPSPVSPSSRNIRQSVPYLRNLWPHLQARPSRARKRGRTSISPITLKRTRPTSSSFLNGLSSQTSFTPWPPQLPESLVTLPLLPTPPPPPTTPSLSFGEEKKKIDLNSLAVEIPDETDFLQIPILQLQGPRPVVISPQPVRPVGSTIQVGLLDKTVLNRSILLQSYVKKAEEVEEEVESESLPAIVSDSNNKVRLANSAYKEMVGQPECSWLDSMVASDGTRACACKRISGEVMIRFTEEEGGVPAKGFSCWVNIEWGKNGEKKTVNVYCDVVRLICESKDYLFAWRFHTRSTT